MADSFVDPELNREPRVATPTHPAIRALAVLIGAIALAVLGAPYIEATAFPQRPHDVASPPYHGPHPGAFPRPGIGPDGDADGPASPPGWHAAAPPRPAV